MKVGDTSRWLALRPCSADRLSSLPDELLDRILSRLSIKDVAVVQVLSKTMSRRAFSVLTNVDFDYHYSPHCPRYPLFLLFVDHVLQKLSPLLSRFRLHMDVDNLINDVNPYQYHRGFPNLSPSCLNKWISYPLRSHVGLTERDLCFHVKNPSYHEIPPSLFACTSLRVLKLNCNLKLESAKIPFISLPNLNILHLRFLLIVDDVIVPRLISTSPFLEDLTISRCFWAQSYRLSISSPSLKRLELCIKKCDESHNTNLVLIDTPNLEYFEYSDNLARCYTVTYMNALFQATVFIDWPLGDGLENLFHVQLTLVRMLTNATHLSLLGNFIENMYYGAELKNQLPMFRYLKTLELSLDYARDRLDVILTEMLLCTPNLETLTLPEGLIDQQEDEINYLEVVDLFTETTPQCLPTRLKRIAIMQYLGAARELSIIRMILKKASSLQELVIVVRKWPANDHLLLERTLREIPRASIDCSIQCHNILL